MTSIKLRAPILLPALLVSCILPVLGGCTGGGEGDKDYGTTITDSSPPPKVDAEAEIAKIQANERMPQAAKDAAIANVRKGAEMAAAQNAAKAKK